MCVFPQIDLIKITFEYARRYNWLRNLTVTCNYDPVSVYLEIELNHVEDWKLEEKKGRSLQFITAVEPLLSGEGITTKKVFPKGESVNQLQREMTCF